MKLFKKAAALFFCLALALSVMAVTALAADEPFILTLAQNATSDTHSNIDGTRTTYADYKTGDTVVYNLILTKADPNTEYAVNAVEFTLTYDTNLTDATVSIGGQEFKPASGGTVYYLAENNATAMADPFAADGASIGTITFTTASSVTPASGATSVDGTFSVSAATVHYAANTQKADVATDTGASATVEIHRDYTITMMRPVFDTTTGVKRSTFEPIKSGDAAVTYTYNIVDSGVNGNNGVIPADEQAYYDFTGWTVAGTNNAQHNWTSTITETGNYTVPAGKYGDVTLTSTFESATYYVTYAQGDGTTTEAVVSRTLTAGTGDNADKYAYTIDNAQAAFGTATRPGYDFAGWKATVTTGATAKWVNDTIYAVPNDATTNFSEMYGDVTLTPQWRAHTYTATFDAGTATQSTTVNGPSSGTATYTIEDYSALGGITITRVGYDFTGWKIENTADVSENETNNVTGWAANDTIPAESGNGADQGNIADVSGKFGTVTFTAQWTPHEYTVTLNKGVTGDNVSAEDVTFATSTSDNTAITSTKYTIESVNNLTAVLPTRKGYIFSGWKVTDAGSAPTSWTADALYNGGAYTSGTAFAVGNYGDIGLTAQWTIDGLFVLKNYNFAYRTSRENGTGDALLFFATNNADAGTYKIDGNVMYDVTSKYSGLDAFNDFTKVYAYIASESLTIDNITFIGGTTAGNAEVNYDGNVNTTSGVDVGDYGTAGTVFRDPTAYKNDTNVGVLERLKMNDASPATGDWIGSIADLAAIITKAATN